MAPRRSGSRDSFLRPLVAIAILLLFSFATPVRDLYFSAAEWVARQFVQNTLDSIEKSTNRQQYDRQHPSQSP